MNAKRLHVVLLRERSAHRRIRQSLLIGSVLLLAALSVPIVAGARSAVLVGHGLVVDRDDLSIWTDPDTVRIENIRTGLAGTAVIGQMGTGSYAVALVDLGGGEAAVEGDVLRYTISLDAGTIIDSLHVLTSSEAANGVVKVDLMASRISSGAGETATFDRPALKAFPNPSRNGEVRLAVRIPGGGSSQPGASDIDLAIFDAAGRMVHSMRGISFEGGAGVVTWNGRTIAGERAAQGAYFVFVRTNEASVEGRFLLIR